MILQTHLHIMETDKDQPSEKSFLSQLAISFAFWQLPEGRQKSREICNGEKWKASGITWLNVVGTRQQAS